jgi:hypothetical protein
MEWTTFFVAGEAELDPRVEDYHMAIAFDHSLEKGAAHSSVHI